MKKYIRAIVCLTYSIIKFSFIKVFHFSSFKFTLFNLISPFTEIDIGYNSRLSLGRLVKARSGCKIRVI